MPRYERDTQVPSSTNNESSQSDKPSHPEHITAVDFRNTTLEEAVANGWVDVTNIPDVVPDLRSTAARYHENAYDLPGNRSSEEIDEPGFWTRAKKIGATAAALVAVGATVMIGSKINSDTPERTTTETSITSDEYTPPLTEAAIPEGETVPEVVITGDSIDKMSYQAANELPSSLLLNHYGPSLDEWRSDSYTYLSPYVSDEQKRFFNDNFPTDKSEYTPQQIANQVAIDLYDVSSQDGKSPDGIEAGRKMAAVVMAPENPEFSESIRRIGTTEAIEMINEVIETYPRLKDVTFRGHEIGSDGAEIMVIESNESGKKFFGLYQLLTTPEGNTTWQFTDTFAYNDLTINKDIAKAVGESQ